jgi:hypothetical protein
MHGSYCFACHVSGVEIKVLSEPTYEVNTLWEVKS